MDYKRVLFLLASVILAISVLIVIIFFKLQNCENGSTPTTTEFDGGRAYLDVANQMAFGPRPVGSEAHAKEIGYIQTQLQSSGWKVEVQVLTSNGHPIQNVIAKRGKGAPWIILGAHFDTRLYADRDPDPANRQLPVPGANDGASGVAILLEIARDLPSRMDKQVWLVFFDAEDNGNIPGWDWILGSREFVAHLSGKPDAAVIVDMVGDANLDIYMEATSDKVLNDEIWGQAADLGYSQFHPIVKNSILDDQTPFLQAEIPAVDIIDINYPYWHTVNDTIDKVSASSLEIVGKTVLTWLLKYNN